MTEISLVAELARMTAYFQARTIATHMGIDPNSVKLSPAASSPAGSEDVCPRNARTSSPHIPEAGVLSLRRPPAAPVDHRAAPSSQVRG
jgi:hypothetical protein